MSPAAGAAQTRDVWFGMWRCGCTDLELSPAAIPARCPEHDREFLTGYTAPLGVDRVRGVATTVPLGRLTAAETDSLVQLTKEVPACPV